MLPLTAHGTTAYIFLLSDQIVAGVDSFQDGVDDLWKALVQRVRAIGVRRQILKTFQKISSGDRRIIGDREQDRDQAMIIEVLFSDNGTGAHGLVVGLPENAGARTHIFQLLSAEENRFGQDFVVEPNGRQGREMTREEAETLGDLDLAGTWMEEQGPLQDVGQSTLRLWWD